MLNSTGKKKQKQKSDKDAKALFKLMSKSVYSKTLENLRKIINEKLVINIKEKFKVDIKSKKHVSQNIRH